MADEAAPKKCCSLKRVLWVVVGLALLVFVGGGVLAGVTGNRDL